ncbi:MFS transporter [Xanthovirga aplysinae]|uniref:MFS transporter n=1 Tax=Xanthovirga aplysinae TaxID=2529853 RepID=UPI0012BC4F2D|nr:MFS transporter [Xanthovirga aplysinae]MTI31556.1 MFS transporter [Xanthovirga aplysinae]
MKSLLSDKKTYLLIAGNIISNIGSGITMIAIPWLLIQRENGEQVYGYATLSLSSLMVILLPLSGRLIDRFSRKKVLITIESIGFLLTLMIAIWEGTREEPQLITLLLLYGIGGISFNLHFPARNAFVQEIFNKKHYPQINGMLEVQGQIAFMLAGGIGGFLLENLLLSEILLIDTATFGLSILLFYLIPYSFKRKEINSLVKHTENKNTSWQFILQQPKIVAFFTLSLLPFTITMVGNFLTPIHLSKSLQAGVQIFSLTETFWAVGSVIAGLTIPFLIKRTTAVKVIIWGIFFYTLSLFLIGNTYIIMLFLGIEVLMGWSNAAIRVARNTALMEYIPNQHIGQISSYIMAFAKIFQVLLLLFLTTYINRFSTHFAYQILFLLAFMILSYCLYQRRSIFTNSPQK